MRKLKELRKLQGMTQSELGNKIGVTKSTISMYESGAHEPDIGTLKNIAETLGVSLDVLLDRKPQASEDDETWLIRERLRRDPDYRILFNAAKTAKPEHLRAAVAVLLSLKGKPDDN